MSDPRINALRQVLGQDPNNHPIRHMLAEALETAQQPADALAEYELLITANALNNDALVHVGELALTQDNLALASGCLDMALKAGVVEGVSGLRAAIDAKLESQGFLRIKLPTADQANEPDPAQIDSQPVINFSDVGGLDSVKKVIHKLIILPLLRPDVYRHYGRRAGGGVLLYGPPGCGKTMLARATAGECQLPFINLRIEDILDPYMGVSERNLSKAFDYARANTPCVLFLDEIDAIGFARNKRTQSVGRSLVDQLLQELDAIGADNDNLLILAATNAPWDLDDAILRPGRFDRRIFVTPPDNKARQRILDIMLDPVPKERLSYRQLAKKTTLFSGADMRALVDRAIDLVIDDALETGTEPPLAMRHLEEALVDLRPTTLDWLERAQNYVEFANQDKRYDEVAKFLKSREVRNWGRR